jgi:DNA-binding NtrC family response regulator
VDVRIVAVTNRELAKRVTEGEFREDLYYRLNAAEIVLPSLDVRLEDIPLLVRHFVDQLNRKHETTKIVDDAVITALTARPWPGNVRELSNEVARLYFLSGDVLDSVQLVRAAAFGDVDSLPMPSSLKLEDMERAAIERALAATEGRKDRAATMLGISRAGLYAKMRRLGLS